MLSIIPGSGASRDITRAAQLPCLDKIFQLPTVVEDSLDSGVLTTRELPAAVAKKLQLDHDISGSFPHTIEEELKLWNRVVRNPNNYTIADVSGRSLIVTPVQASQRDIGAKLAKARTANMALLAYPTTRDIAAANGTLLDSVTAMWKQISHSTTASNS